MRELASGALPVPDVADSTRRAASNSTNHFLIYLMTTTGFKRFWMFVAIAAGLTACSDIKKEYQKLERLSARMDAAQAKKKRQKHLTQAEKEAAYDKDIEENGDWAGLTQPASARLAKTPEERARMEAEELEEKKELAAYNRRLAGSNDAEPAERRSAPLEIESIDRSDSGWGTITYTSGTTRGISIGGRDYPWFAYSSTMIVVHNGRYSCKVMDPDMNTISDGSTQSSGDFVALRIIGNNIIIETEDGQMLRTQTYDKHLSLLKNSARFRDN